MDIEERNRIIIENYEFVKTIPARLGFYADNEVLTDYDLQEECVLALIEILEKKGNIDNLRAIVTTCARKRLIDLLRKVKRGSRVFSETGVPYLMFKNYDIEIENSAQCSMNDSQYIDLRDVFERLSDYDRHILNLIYFQDIPGKQVASDQRVSEALITTQKKRALRNLRELFNL